MIILAATAALAVRTVSPLGSCCRHLFASGGSGDDMKFDKAQFGVYATDHDLEQDGIRVKLDADSDMWFEIRRSGGANHAYDRAVQRNSKQYQRQLARGILANDVAEREIIRPAFIHACMIGWHGIRDESGKEIPYSDEACKTLFTELPDIYDMLREQANELSNFRIREQQETAERLGES